MNVELRLSYFNYCSQKFVEHDKKVFKMFIFAFIQYLCLNFDDVSTRLSHNEFLFAQNYVYEKI